MDLLKAKTSCEPEGKVEQYRRQKNCEVWREKDLFGPYTVPYNPLQSFIAQRML
jgi:hypothetical protein